jgi:hypothetical protein
LLTQQWRNCLRRCVLCGSHLGSWNPVSSALKPVENLTAEVGGCRLGQFSPGASSWSKYRLKPAVRVWDRGHPVRMWSRKQRKVRRSNPLPNKVTEDTSMFVIVICEMYSGAVKLSNKSECQPKPRPLHPIAWQYYNYVLWNKSFISIPVSVIDNAHFLQQLYYNKVYFRT